MRRPREEYKSFSQKMRHKFRLTLSNENKQEDLWSFRVSRLDALYLTGVAVVLIFIAAGLLISMTPLRNYLPGYMSWQVRQDFIDSQYQLDSITTQVERRNNYIAAIQALLLDKISTDSIVSIDSIATIDSVIMLPKLANEKAFVEQYYEQEKFNLALVTNTNAQEISFIKPLNGLVRATMQPANGLFGIHIRATQPTQVMATTDGTVIATVLTIEQGWAIYIQHADSYLSVYKLLDNSFVKTGDKVKLGEAIAVINTKQTQGDLCFELWKNGAPVNPLEYILF